MELGEGFALSELRIRFIRSEGVKYISHLDIMKVFERAVRRAEIKIAYSKGFNPHPHIVFGLPMGVGLSSFSEFADIFLDETMEPEIFIEKINRELPEGVKVLDAKVKTAKGNIMSQIEAASYEVSVRKSHNYDDILYQAKLKEFLAKDTIMFLKENKSGKRVIDIKPLILEVEVKSSEADDRVVFHMLLKAGQNGNVKPEQVIECFKECSDLQIEIISTVRTALFTQLGGKLDNPMDDRILLQLG